MGNDSGDIVYLGPPLTSDRNFNALFRKESAEHKTQQAFDFLQD